MMEFPLIEEQGKGYRVRTSMGSYLPGIYTNYIMAQKHMQRYTSQSRAAKRKRAKQTKKEE